MTGFDGEPDDNGLGGPSLLPPEESLDDEEVGLDLDEGYSPGERARALETWGTTDREQSVGESLAIRLRREEPDVSDGVSGDGIGDIVDTDGEPRDDQVGDLRAGRLVYDDDEPVQGEPGRGRDVEHTREYWAVDVGIDGAAATAEEAAVHLVPDDADFADELMDDPDEQAARSSSDDGARVFAGRIVAGGGETLGAAADTDALDDMAAFLMRHSYAGDVTEAERLEIFAIVEAHQEGDDPATVERALRRLAARFRTYPDYRPEWVPGQEPPG
ncbi:MAG TPA: DUF5709 domain-containing protein [Jatrophihabitans sp.]|nr:DUF5709 domain-containing protein [Jatrophihabitans sp.]